MKKYIISIAIILVLPALVLAYFQPATLTNGIDRVAVYTQDMAQKYFGQGYLLEDKNQEAGLGAAAGTTHTFPEKFLAGFGGEGLATTTNGANTTLKESEMNRYNYFDMSPQKQSFNYTFPATSSLSNLLKNVGDTKSWWFHNATSTAGITLTLIAGTGWDLVGSSTASDVLAPGSYAKMSCLRQIATTSAIGRNIVCGVYNLIAID